MKSKKMMYICINNNGEFKLIINAKTKKNHEKVYG